MQTYTQNKWPVSLWDNISRLKILCSWKTTVSFAIFLIGLGFHIWGVSVGWRSLNLPGQEFRQAQTALSALYIEADDDFSLNYPTPVLGKPWSIPMEFPLYQWSAVGLRKATNLGLIKSGRTVSITCFYLMLPALFLLLGRCNVTPGRRWLVLTLVVTSPIYIYYTRGFLIETMALMFGLWFWVAYERSVASKSLAWLMVASVAGAGVGLVKVTTFIVYLVPPFLWSVMRLWRTRREARWIAQIPWLVAGVVIPLASTYWWSEYADAVRLQNPLGHFLGSDNLTSFIFGTWALRTSPELWGQKWDTTVLAVSSMPALITCLVLAFFTVRERIRPALAFLGYFFVPLVIFPLLYGWHDYYFVANGVLLLIAMGLIIVGLSERARLGWIAILAVLAVSGGQAYQYLKHYYPSQSGIGLGGDDMSRVLHGMTKPDEVVIVLGQQWNPMSPFYAKRRMMMIREEDERREWRLDAAFAAMQGEKIGALVIAGPMDNRAALLRRISTLGIDSQPIFKCQDMLVFLREDRRDESIEELQSFASGGLTLMPGVLPRPELLAGKWYKVSGLKPLQMGWFLGMTPKPVRFFNTFGPSIELAGGKHDYGAHPVTRLVFSLKSGDHTLRTTVRLPEESHVPSDPNVAPSDGVNIRVSIVSSGHSRRIVYERYLNPHENPDDRGLVQLHIPFHLEHAEEVELYFGPGPVNDYSRDWLVMGDLVID